MRKFVMYFLVAVFLCSAFSLSADRRRPARSGMQPTFLTKQTSLSVVGPNEKGEYSAPFVAWFPVSNGTTVSSYTVDVNGNKTPIVGASFTVTAENADHGWAMQLWGPFTGGYAPIPTSSGIVAFRVEFTGNFQTYSVNARVPDGTRATAVVDVYPDGKLFLKQSYAVLPVASLNGRGHPVVNGWITPTQYYTGSDVVVAVCSGFPDSQCQTQVVDIPAPQTNAGKTFSFE